MKYRKIVFIDYAPLTSKIYEDFYIDDIVERGISVDYWDISFAIQHKSDLPSYHKNEISKKFSSYIQIIKDIKHNNNSDTLYVSLMVYNGKVLLLFLIFSILKCQTAAFGYNTIPSPTFSNVRVLNESKITWGLLKNAFLNKVSLGLKMCGIIKGFDVLFVGGKKGLKGYGRSTAKEITNAKIININSTDYDKILQTGFAQSRQEDIIVFIDEYLPFHPDNSINNLKTIDPSYYYKYLNRFFRKVEERFKIPVIIAAHPKSVKYKSKNYFEGRKIYFGETMSLCHKAKMILAHDSTAISYAVVFKKPLLFLNFHLMQKEHIYTYESTEAFAEALGQTSIIIDNECIPEYKTPSVDERKYNDYIYTYLSSPDTQNIHSKNIILNYFVNG